MVNVYKKKKKIFIDFRLIGVVVSIVIKLFFFVLLLFKIIFC